MNPLRNLLVFVLTASLIGCSRGGHVPVEGRVTLDGSPVAGASVTFVPSAGGRPGAAITDASGRFALWEAGMKQGLPLGNYAVSVFKVVWKPGATVSAPGPGPPAASGTHRMIEQPVVEREIEQFIVPQRYIDPHTSGLRVSVTAATKDVNIDLTTEP